MPNSRPSGFGLTFLVGGILLLSLEAVALNIPIANCPRCDGSGIRARIWCSSHAECRYCDGLGKTTLVKKWTLLRNAPAR